MFFCGERCFLRENPFFLEKERVLSRSLLKKAAWVFLFRRAEGAPERRIYHGDETKPSRPPLPPRGGRRTAEGAARNAQATGREQATIECRKPFLFLKERFPLVF